MKVQIVKKNYSEIYTGDEKKTEQNSIEFRVTGEEGQDLGNGIVGKDNISLNLWGRDYGSPDQTIERLNEALATLIGE